MIFLQSTSLRILALAPAITSSESMGVAEAFSHSFAVVRGHRLKLGALLLILLGLPFLIQMGGYTVLYPGDVVLTESEWQTRIQLGALFGVVTVVGSSVITSVSIAAAYYQLSSRSRPKHGDVNTLQEVFR